MFSTSRKIAQQTAQQLIAGHFTITAWWTLRHAGVLEAILKHEAEHQDGLNPLVHATRTSMSPEVLSALLNYLATAGLVVFKGEEVSLTAEGKALYEHEDGVLQLIRAYQPVLDMSEHLLAKLKSYGVPGVGGAGGVAGAGSGVGAGGGVYRKSEYLLGSQAKRYGPEVFPAIQDLIAKNKLTHLLDISCGTGELLVHLASQLRNVVGVGIGADSSSVRRANTAITDSGHEKRLIAVTANPADVCGDTQRTFDRIGISRQLWNEIDCIIATNVFSEFAMSNGTDSATTLTRMLLSTRKNFPRAHLLIVESVASPRFEKNYYAPELSLLLQLSRSTPKPPEAWRELFGAARFALAAEVPLVTEGISLFLCKPAGVASTVVAAQ